MGKKEFIKFTQESGMPLIDINREEIRIYISMFSPKRNYILWTDNPLKLLSKIKEFIVSYKLETHTPSLKSLINITVLDDGSFTIQSLKLGDDKYKEIPFIQNPVVVKNMGDDMDSDQDNSILMNEYRTVFVINFDLMTFPEKAK